MLFLLLVTFCTAMPGAELTSDPQTALCILLCQHGYRTQDQSPRDEELLKTVCHCSSHQQMHDDSADAWPRIGRRLTLDPIPEPILPTPEQVNALVQSVQDRGAVVRIENPDGTVSEVIIPPRPLPKQSPHHDHNLP